MDGFFVPPDDKDDESYSANYCKEEQPNKNNNPVCQLFWNGVYGWRKRSRSVPRNIACKEFEC